MKCAKSINKTWKGPKQPSFSYKFALSNFCSVYSRNTFKYGKGTFEYQDFAVSLACTQLVKAEAAFVMIFCNSGCSSIICLSSTSLHLTHNSVK